VFITSAQHALRVPHNETPVGLPYADSLFRPPRHAPA
jgi:hypothetical protein